MPKPQPKVEDVIAAIAQKAWKTGALTGDESIAFLSISMDYFEACETPVKAAPRVVSFQESLQAAGWIVIDSKGRCRPSDLKLAEIKGAE